MDFTIVKRQIITEYLILYGCERKNDIWSLGAVIDVFRLYYASYEETFGISHPKLSNKSINAIINDLPWLDSYDTNFDRNIEIELFPEDYQTLIPQYFMQRFDNCNYSMAHFMSGDIRLMRYYETLY